MRDPGVRVSVIPHPTGLVGLSILIYEITEQALPGPFHVHRPGFNSTLLLCIGVTLSKILNLLGFVKCGGCEN